MTDKRTVAHVKANVGNDRDFLARFNAPGYSPFTAAKAPRCSAMPKGG